MADFLKVYVKIYSSIFTTASVESQYTDFHLSLNNSNLKCLTTMTGNTSLARSVDNSGLVSHAGLIVVSGRFIIICFKFHNLFNPNNG